MVRHVTWWNPTKGPEPMSFTGSQSRSGKKTKPWWPNPLKSLWHCIWALTTFALLNRSASPNTVSGTCIWEASFELIPRCWKGGGGDAPFQSLSGFCTHVRIRVGDAFTISQSARLNLMHRCSEARQLSRDRIRLTVQLRRAPCLIWLQLGATTRPCHPKQAFEKWTGSWDIWFDFLWGEKDSFYKERSWLYDTEYA